MLTYYKRWGGRVVRWCWVNFQWGWSGGAMVLGKLPVRPTNLDKSRARAYCACSRCGWGWFGHFFSRLSSLFSFSLSLWDTARYRLKYCLKGPLSPKQPTNQTSSAGASYNFDYSRARAYCACSRCGGGLDIFTLIYPFFSFSFSLGDGPI